nr:transmembrane protein 40 isoform X2 [Marmota flaviventris]
MAAPFFPSWGVVGNSQVPQEDLGPIALAGRNATRVSQWGPGASHGHGGPAPPCHGCAWPVLPLPSRHPHSLLRVALLLGPEEGPRGKAMDASGSSSHSQDDNQIHKETQDLDHSGDEDRHLRVPGKRGRGRSPGPGHPLRDRSPGAEHGVPDILKDELQLYGGGEVMVSGESGIRRRGSDSASGEEEAASELQRLNIKKDDEFFHFVLLCFAIGALLVCYHYYADWFMSLGVGLLTFASLETMGIYFGLVYRVHSVLQGFIPLFQKLIGFKKTH